MGLPALKGVHCGWDEEFQEMRRSIEIDQFQ